MADDFATTDELAGLLDFDLDGKTRSIATGALYFLSEDARFYGRAWTEPSVAPSRVKRLVLGAAQRFMTNYEGYTTSRAGDETLTWTDRGVEAGSPHFIQREINELRQLGGHNGGLHSVSVNTWSHRDKPKDIYIGTDPEGAPMPWVAGDEAEWWGYS